MVHEKQGQASTKAKIQKTLIFVGGHPDDETFGHGGTLAQYSTAGVKVYCICATRGEAGTIDPQFMKGYATTGDLRWAELQCAARVLGLADVIYLGYRDSGMEGSKDNQHPNALCQAPLEEVTEKIVKIIRKLQPQVVITFDPNGGYRHPDHIAVHKATVQAFNGSGDPVQYPSAGRPFQPSKLYYGVFPHRFMRLAVKVMPLFGQNPHQFGRNKDMDLTEMVQYEYPVHAAIRLTEKTLQIREKASACHASQLEGGTPHLGLLGLIFRLSGMLNGLFGVRDYYMRAYPPPSNHHIEKDLFEGID